MSNKSNNKTVWSTWRKIIISLCLCICTFSLFAQNKISGKVIDANGEIVVGANVVLKGTSYGVMTDQDGNFSLQAGSEDILVVSLLGYSTQEITVGSQTYLTITLQESFQSLDDVVVVGYGTQKRSDLIGSVGSISQKSLEGRATLTIQQALQGKVPGVLVTARDGQPGSAPTVRIRGIGTLNNNDPLYIVDGVPMTNGLEVINNQDIESIEILKDAASASIYGSRSGNGVVLVTTKKGTQGRPVIFYDGTVGYHEASKKIDLLNASEYMTIIDETRVNSGYAPYWTGKTPRADTDWLDQIFRKGFVQSHSLGVKGSLQNVRYYLSAGLDKQDGMLIETDYKRYSLKSNVEVDLNSKLTVGVNLNYIYIRSTTVAQGDNGILISAVRMPATVPVYNEDGTFGRPLDTEGDAQNPVGYSQRNKRYNYNYRTLISGYGEYKILPYLRFRSNFGADVSNSDWSQYLPRWGDAGNMNTTPQLSENYSKNNSISFENTLTFDKSFNKHQVTAMIGQSVITYDTKSTNASKYDFPADDESLRYFSAGTGTASLTGGRDEFALMSYFGRVNYNYAGKYLFQANIRADGSSRFGPNNRWGQFPSAGVGWRISEEEFLKNVDWLSNLKLKGSYGVLGTMPNQYYGFMSTLVQIKYVMGENQALITGYYPGSVDNKDFKWETSYQTNVGFDLGLFRNKLSLTAEYYQKDTKNILQVLPLPSYSGTSGSLTNIGEMKNKGVEISATLNNNAGDFNYSVSGNITTIKNTVVKLFDNDAPIESGYSRTEVGQSIGSFYGWVTDGIFQNEAEVAAHKVQPNAVPGDIRFKNLNGDDKLDGNDRTFIGNPIPTFTYGGNIGLEYKGIDFSLSIYGVAGSDIWYWSRHALLNGQYGFNKSAEILARWQKEGDITNIPRLSTTSANDNFRNSDLFLCNGSYLRLSNIQLGYTFKSSVTKKVGISRLRIYASANNLVTISDYPGFDPEVTIENPLAPGNDYFFYPVPRTVLFGLNLTF